MLDVLSDVVFVDTCVGLTCVESTVLSLVVVLGFSLCFVVSTLILDCLFVFDCFDVVFVGLLFAGWSAGDSTFSDGFSVGVLLGWFTSLVFLSDGVFGVALLGCSSLSDGFVLFGCSGLELSGLFGWSTSLVLLSDGVFGVVSLGCSSLSDGLVLSGCSGVLGVSGLLGLGCSGCEGFGLEPPGSTPSFNTRTLRLTSVKLSSKS